MPPLNKGDIFVLVHEQLAGEGTFADAAALIHHFVSCMKSGKEVDKRLLSYMAHQFDAYLSQKTNAHRRTLEQCFGLSSCAGRPTKTDRDVEICTTALHQYLYQADGENRTLDDCLTEVSSGLDRESLRKIWRNHKWQAYEAIDTRHVLANLQNESFDWPESQAKRLHRLKLL